MDLRKLLQTNSNKLVEVSGIKQIEYSKEIPQAFNATNEKLASSSQSSFPSTSLTTKNQDNVFTPHNVMVQNNNLAYGNNTEFQQGTTATRENTSANISSIPNGSIDEVVSGKKSSKWKRGTESINEKISLRKGGTSQSIQNQEAQI